ncbi:unnamed protein product [Gongylonema pulchrum]|uniref:PUA domain-containing protein n=1 Tax=Gongylonema pulchrum TaxID=637853 RepID=A0A183DWY5_9BILA|nr:unnamed protein product [Gongylonema pulchrum]
MARVCPTVAVHHLSKAKREETERRKGKRISSIIIRVQKLAKDNKPDPENKLVGRRLTAEVICEGVPMPALIVSGAMVPLITPEALQRISAVSGREMIKRIWKRDDAVIRDASGHQMALLGTVKVQIKWGGISKPVTMSVDGWQRDSELLLLGTNALEQCKE